MKTLNNYITEHMFSGKKTNIANQLNMEFVDLGLPSGTLWCTKNIGATNPEETGDYFAWGEKKPKDLYEWDNYEFGDRDDKMIKYNDDNLSELDDSDDIASITTAKQCKIPSVSQFEELDKFTNVTRKGKCYIFESKKNPDNYIILPIGGFKTAEGEISSIGYLQYWTNQVSENDEYCRAFAAISDNYGSIFVKDRFRRQGRLIRPVKK